MKNDRLKPLVKNIIGEWLQNYGARFAGITEIVAEEVAPVVALHVRKKLQEFLDSTDFEQEVSILRSIITQANVLKSDLCDPIADMQRLERELRTFVSFIVDAGEELKEKDGAK